MNKRRLVWRLAFGCAGLATCVACSLDFGAFDPRDTAGAGGVGASSTDGGSGGAPTAAGGSTTSQGGQATGGSTSVGGGGGAAGGSAPTPCGVTQAFQHDFTLAPNMGVYSYDGPQHSGGAIKLDVDTADDYEAFSTYGAARFVEGAVVRVELDGQAINGVGQIELLMPTSNERLGFGTVDGMLRIRTPDGARVEFGPYDPVAHRWLQMVRLPDGSVRAETSVDGVTFVTQGTVPLGAVGDPETARIRLVSSLMTGEMTSSATFDNLNIGLPLVPFCPMETFGFDLAQSNSQTDAPWIFEVGCSYDVDSAGVVMHSHLANNRCGLRAVSARAYGGTTVEVSEVNSSAVGASVELRVFSNDVQYVEFRTSDGLMRCAARGNTLVNTSDGPAYDPSYRFWRIRVDGTTAYGEVSMDGATFMPACSVPYTPIDTPYRVRITSHSPTALSAGTALARIHRVIAQP